MKLFKKTSLLILSSLSILLIGCGKEEPQETITISINPTSIELFEEDYGLVSAETNSKKPISFVSENSDIVSVNSSGVLLAKSAGRTTIKASVEDVFAICSVTVRPISEKDVDYIGFDKTHFVIGLNEESYENVITPTYYHNEEPLSGKTFEYTSLDQDIVTVNSDGMFFINSTGVASILVTCGSISNKVTIDVYDIVIRSTNDWLSMLSTTKKLDARFYLDSDLDFTGVTYVPYFSYDNNLMGELKGNYHTVSNIAMTSNDAVQSIFGYATVFSLSNIRFINITFNSTKKNGGLFTSLYQHYNGNKTGKSSVSNVLCDFVFSDVTSCVIADKFYGANVDNVYAKVRSATGKELKDGNTYLMAYSYYTWYGTSHFVNLIGLVENGNMTKIVKNANPADEDYYPNTITEVKTDVANTIIEANYLASLSFDSTIWNIAPNELPTFIK